MARSVRCTLFRLLLNIHLDLNFLDTCENSTGMPLVTILNIEHLKTKKMTIFPYSILSQRYPLNIIFVVVQRQQNLSTQ